MRRRPSTFTGTLHLRVKPSSSSITSVNLDPPCERFSPRRRKDKLQIISIAVSPSAFHFTVHVKQGHDIDTTLAAWHLMGDWKVTVDLCDCVELHSASSRLHQRLKRSRVNTKWSLFSTYCSSPRVDNYLTHQRFRWNMINISDGTLDLNIYTLEPSSERSANAALTLACWKYSV